MTKLFNIKYQVKKTNIDAMFDSSSKANLIVEYLAKKMGLEVHNHIIPYPVGLVKNDT
jgi:hypothetical protein